MLIYIYTIITMGSAAEKREMYRIWGVAAAKICVALSVFACILFEIWKTYFGRKSDAIGGSKFHVIDPKTEMVLDVMANTSVLLPPPDNFTTLQGYPRFQPLLKIVTEWNPGERALQ